MERLKRKKNLPKMTGKQKMKHRNATLRFTSITGMMMEHEQIKENSRIEKEKVAEPENNNEEEIEKNEKIFMVESQSEDYEKKAEVVGKADNEESRQ